MHGLRILKNIKSRITAKIIIYSTLEQDIIFDDNSKMDRDTIINNSYNYAIILHNNSKCKMLDDERLVFYIVMLKY